MKSAFILQYYLCHEECDSSDNFKRRLILKITTILSVFLYTGCVQYLEIHGICGIQNKNRLFINYNSKKVE